MSYNHLNSTCKAFSTNIFGVSILKNIQKELENLKWRDVVPDEIRAPERKETLEKLQNFQEIERQSIVSGCLLLSSMLMEP